MPKWLVVARNEYRIHTSRIRRVRPYFPYMVIGLLVVYVVFIAPAFVSLFVDDFLVLLLSQAAIAMMQIILFLIFIYFMIIPITDTLREEQTGQLEIFLAAPIKPSDVLLGEFIGEMPFYAIFVTVITGGLTALLNPLRLDIGQITIIIIIFVVTFLSAFWIGTVIAALLRTQLGKTARSRDIGRGLAMIIALPLVAMIYGIQFGGLLQALVDTRTSETVRVFLNLLPSSWGAEVVVSFASSPGNISAVGFETMTRFGGLLTFFLAVLWLGVKAANRVYSLEPATFTASRAKPDGFFYYSIKHFGGSGSLGTLLVSIFKDYSRRLENLSMLTYMLGVLVIMSVFIVPKSGSSDVPIAFMLVQFIFPVVVVMVTGEVIASEKDNLYIYKKAPSGVGRFVKVMLLKNWLMTVPIAGVITAATSLLSPGIIPNSLLVNAGLMMLFVAAFVVFVLGLFLLNPVFSKKSVKLALNIIIAISTSIGFFAISLFILTRAFVNAEPISSMIYLQSLQTILCWLTGIVFLYMGKRRIDSIE